MQHVYLGKSLDDPNTYLVNDTADPLQRSLNCMDLTDVPIGAPTGAVSTWAAPAGERVTVIIAIAAKMIIWQSSQCCLSGIDMVAELERSC